MPQPLPAGKGITTVSPPKRLLKRPKLASLIGTIASEWGYIDDCLVDIFEGVVSEKATRDKVAVTVFETLSSLHMRLELLSKILHLLAPEHIRDEFDKKVSPLLRKAASERNKIVHGAWEISDDYPDDLILKEAGGRLTRWTEKDLENSLDRIMPARAAAHKMAIAVQFISKDRQQTRPRQRR